MKHKALAMVILSYLILQHFGATLIPLFGWLLHLLVPFFMAFFIPKLGRKYLYIIAGIQSSIICAAMIPGSIILFSIPAAYAEVPLFIRSIGLLVYLVLVSMAWFMLYIFDYYFNLWLLKRWKLFRRVGVDWN